MDLSTPLSILREQVISLGKGLIAHLPQVAVALVVLFLTWFCARFLSGLLAKVVTRLHLRSSLRFAISKIFAVGIWVIGLLMAATIVFPSVTPGKLVAGLGLTSVAVGFAFKNVFENFFAGLVVLMRNDVETGDVIRCEGICGRVEEITLRDTHLMTLDGRKIVLPNAMIFNSPVEILTKQSVRRQRLDVGVSYESDLAEARRAIRGALRELEGVSRQREPEVELTAFGGSSVDFAIYWWSGSEPADQRASRDAVVEAVKRALDDAEIDIPYPIQELRVERPLAVATQKLERAA